MHKKFNLATKRHKIHKLISCHRQIRPWRIFVLFLCIFVVNDLSA